VSELLTNPRALPAPTLPLELRETIARWFAARDANMQSSELILSALADLAAEQITANPTYAAQTEVIGRFTQDVFSGCNAANRRRMGGIAVTIVKQ
jgi:hypothetical protein